MYIFLYDNLLNPEQIDKLKLPINFVTFAFIEDAKLFTYEKNTVAVHYNTGTIGRQGDYVFGAIYALEEPKFYIRVLDAQYCCSLSRIGVNHTYDKHHRMAHKAIPIRFDTLQELKTFRFKRYEALYVDTYFANEQDEKLLRRIRHGKYRIIHGVDVPHFKKLCEREGIR